jgi:hypothetical protein
MAIDVQDVVTQFGAHYKPGSDNQKNLRNMIYKPGETAQFFAPRPTDDTIWRGTLATLDRVVQPFQKTFTPISTIKFEPNQFPLYKLKINLQETPDDLEATYLGFLASIPELDRSQWPFVRWWLEQHVNLKKEEDLETEEYGKGVFVAPQDGVAGPAGSSMNGIRKVLQGYNAAGRLNLKNGPIDIGQIAEDPADFCTQVEDFVRAIPSLFRNKLDYIFMSPDLELRYKDGKDAKYNKNYAKDADLLTVNKFSNISVKGLESHRDMQLLWATLPANRIRPQKKAVLKDTMRLQVDIIQVKAHTEWWEALNYEVPEFVFTTAGDMA